MPAVDPVERGRRRVEWASLSLSAAANDLDEAIQTGAVLDGTGTMLRQQAVTVAGLLERIDEAKALCGRSLRRVRI